MREMGGGGGQEKSDWNVDGPNYETDGWGLVLQSIASHAGVNQSGKYGRCRAGNHFLPSRVPQYRDLNLPASIHCGVVEAKRLDSPNCGPETGSLLKSVV
jgi:hypothetical protein